MYNEFKPGREFCTIKDLSYGKENVAISCVNSIDRNFPEYVEYSTVRLPQPGVNLNTDEEFLAGCDCTDDCRNKDKCACWQLTITATRCDRDDKLRKDVGYQFRRLDEVVVTGIYECNKNCSCAKTCLNRVVQHPLRVKLQVPCTLVYFFKLLANSINSRFSKPRKEAGASGRFMTFLKELSYRFMLEISTQTRKLISKAKTLAMNTLRSWT